MEAQDILTATHKLEASGMTRSQSETIAETIIAAVAPLATRKDLDATRADIAALREENKAEFAVLREENKTEFAALREENKTEFAALREENKAGLAALRGDTKADTAALKEQMATKTDIANINTKFEVVNTKIESAKLRFSILFLGLIGSLLAVAASNAFG